MTPDSPAPQPLRVGAPFGARLRRAMDERGPLCVGIDPHAALLADWGLSDDVTGLERFTRTVVDALAGQVAVLKPQSAFFERFGSRGTAVLERAVADARAAGALVVLDAKRGDIGSTMAAYADAYLAPGAPLFCDALTVSPYLGYGSLRPAIDLAKAHGRGLFVLALTSNPEGAGVQHAVRGEDGRSVAAAVLRELAAENAAEAAAESAAGEPAAGQGEKPAGAAGQVDARGPLGAFGAVVGATLGGALAALDVELRIGGPLLAPGIGAQGASAADLPRVFGSAVGNVLPSVSRGVLKHGPSVAALREAAAAETASLAEVIPPHAGD